ncbi:MAG: cellulose synthase family protein [Planctomycetota bacterium]
MDAFAWPMLVYFVTVVAVLSIYGVHRYALVWTYLHRVRGTSIPTPTAFTDLPSVTVQLPMFNEQHVATRIIEAAAAIDYPADRLQIQVLDDSTDESADIARRTCDRLAEQGVTIEYRHRTDRRGYKAGALEEGLESATGEFIAIFDADFIPPAAFLHDTIHHFSAPDIGMVQARWGHLNRNQNWLTRIQAICLDGHFAIEQAARSAAGHWFNFNGTAGMWRRRCIDDAGGWQHDTLTEDTDLSYRAQLEGWTFRYLRDVECPAELPPTMGAFLSQQRRWTKGLMQTAIKLMPRILRSDAPIGTKVDAWFHLTSAMPYVAIFLLSLLILPASFTMLPLWTVPSQVVMALGLMCLCMGTIAACVFYITSQRCQGRSIVGAILMLPALMAVGIGVSASNSMGALEAVFGHQTAFVRTPKFNGKQASAADPALRRRSLFPPGTLEVVLGIIMLVCVGLALTRPFTLVGAVFLLLFAAGFLTVGIPRFASGIMDARPSRATAIKQTPTPAR